MEQEKPIPTMIYGLVGVAAVGAISLILLAIVIAGAPAEQFTLAAY